MNKFVLILMGVAVSSFFAWQGASSWPQPEEVLSTEPVPAAQQTTIDPTQAVVQFLGDIDDLLDTVHDRASFASVKPKLLARARKQAALAAQHPNQGLSQLSRSAQVQWQNAANRHTESLARAIEADPDVADFFANELAPILSPK